MFVEEPLKEKVDYLLNTLPGNMGETLGIEYLSFKKDEIVARMPVNSHTRQPFGFLHGGASVALAESLASVGAWLNLPDKNMGAAGIEINANHVRSAKEGYVKGTAVPLHRGSETHVWRIQIKNEKDQMISVSRCTLAIMDN